MASLEYRTFREEQEKQREDYRKSHPHGLNDEKIKAAHEAYRKEREHLAKTANQYGYVVVK